MEGEIGRRRKKESPEKEREVCTLTRCCCSLARYTISHRNSKQQPMASAREKLEVGGYFSCIHDQSF